MGRATIDSVNTSEVGVMTAATTQNRDYGVFAVTAQKRGRDEAQLSE